MTGCALDMQKCCKDGPYLIWGIWRDRLSKRNTAAGSIQTRRDIHAYLHVKKQKTDSEESVIRVVSHRKIIMEFKCFGSLVKHDLFYNASQ